jgi:uncharacterized protein (DUF58 family)
MVKQGYQDLLKPEIINNLKGLSLIARTTVEGYFSGLNHSKRLGVGMEFSQYRGYEPGDDLRLLDWKMLARSGRYYIKQSEIETQLKLRFILDASRSMLHTEEGLSKIDFSKVLIASLGWLAQSQGDAIGLYILNNKQQYELQPQIDKRHFNRLLQNLIDISPQGKWNGEPLYKQRQRERGFKELIVFISDFHEEDSELTQAVTKLKTPKNEVLVMHLLGKHELTFNHTGSLTFEDLESGERMEVDAKQSRDAYLQSMEDSIQNLKDLCLNQGINYHRILLGEPLGETLQLIIKKRKILL